MLIEHRPSCGHDEVGISSFGHHVNVLPPYAGAGRGRCLQINPLPKTANIGVCLTAADKGRDIILSLTH